jgi:hypothetical protein
VAGVVEEDGLGGGGERAADRRRRHVAYAREAYFRARAESVERRKTSFLSESLSETRTDAFRGAVDDAQRSLFSGEKKRFFFLIKKSATLLTNDRESRHAAPTP